MLPYEPLPHGKPVRVGALVVAAGASTRMQGVDKLRADLGGVPLLARTLAAFEASPDIHRLVVVTSTALWQAATIQKAAFPDGWAKCAGGATRQASVKIGLHSLRQSDIVVVHDGARPLVTPDLIRRGIAQAREYGSALCAVPAKSTHKLVGPDGVVHSTPPRARLWEAQTPQVFRYRELLDAHTAAARDGREYTDDAALMEAEGYEVRVYEGAYSNIKVTTPEDLLVARALLASAE